MGRNLHWSIVAASEDQHLAGDGVLEEAASEVDSTVKRPTLPREFRRQPSREQCWSPRRSSGRAGLFIVEDKGAHELKGIPGQ
jgi:hypothetical protein